MQIFHHFVLLHFVPDLETDLKTEHRAVWNLSLAKPALAPRTISMTVSPISILSSRFRHNLRPLGIDPSKPGLFRQNPAAKQAFAEPLDQS